MFLPKLFLPWNRGNKFLWNFDVYQTKRCHISVKSIFFTKEWCGNEAKKMWYNSITSTNSPSFCMRALSGNITILTVFLSQSHDRTCYVSRPILAPPPLWMIYAHTTSRTLLTCDISLGLQTLPAPQAGGFVELILPYWYHSKSQDAEFVHWGKAFSFSVLIKYRYFVL